MAKSPTHKFGQIIGDLFERSMEATLVDFVNSHSNLYLDKKGYRPARGNKKKLSWKDKFGNVHDLDFVIEVNGTENNFGNPTAFIEIAWRRYTKHSRNKAQEIQGAILPLYETYKNNCPFIGAIIAGDFTEGAKTQLISRGFELLYFDYKTIIDAFSLVGIDAFFDEETADNIVKDKVKAYEALMPEQVSKIEEELRIIKKDEINRFIDALNKTILRKIERIIINTFHGSKYKVHNINDAIRYIENYKIDHDSLVLNKFEILIRYTNGDRIDAFFNEREKAIDFLNKYV